MKRSLLYAIIWAMGAPFFVQQAISSQAGEGAPLEMSWAVSGTGGAHLLVEPGELEIRVLKRDLSVTRAAGAELKAMLLSPDREILDTVSVPHSGRRSDGGKGPVQSAMLRARVERPGICLLQITTAGDRHGVNVEWAIETNAAGWVLENARGHRDDEHREPIVMYQPERSADVYFLPRRGEFTIEVEALPPDAAPLLLFDADGKKIAEIPVEKERRTAIRGYMQMPRPDRPEASAAFTVAADQSRGDRPWRLHLPQAQFLLEIEGVTRWSQRDLFPDQAVWTPVGESWFPFLENRWLISPYHRTAHVRPGAGKEIQFTVYNNAAEARVIDLKIEFPGAPWDVRLSSSRVSLKPQSQAKITARFNGPRDGVERIAHVRATPRGEGGVTTYATLRARGDTSPEPEPLDLPHVLEPYAHENRQYGYLPDYAVDNDLYFDMENHGFVVDGSYLHREKDGKWVTIDLRKAVKETVPPGAGTSWRAAGTKIAFDAANHVYLLGMSGRNIALLRSDDGGETFTAYVIEGREGERRSWDLEQFSGHNVPDGPPAVVRLTRTDRNAGLPPARLGKQLRWRSTNDLELIIAEETKEGGLQFHEPVKLTELALGTSMHSGIPSMVVSRGAKVHVVWGEATNPEASTDEVPGVPAYVATYDRETRTAGEPVYMSFGPPPNDAHNTPSITMDGKGYLHVVVGTHGRPFQYLRSLKPNDAYSGWTEAIRTSEEELRQTYVGLVCDAEDNLHLVFRLWRSGEEHLDGNLWAALAHQRKPFGGEWEKPQILVAPPLSEYSIYYHRLTVDRKGNIVLNYDYWSTSWFYRNDSRGPVAAGSGREGRGWGRSVIMSPDNGKTWRFY